MEADVGSTMALEPELLKLTLPAFLRLWQLGGQYTSWDASWAVTAGAASTLRHELARLVLLRHPKQRPLFLQLALAASLRLRQLGGQYASWDASWAVAAGAAGTLLHELVLLVLLRHPRQRPLSLQLARAERAGLPCSRRAIRSLPSRAAR